MTSANPEEHLRQFLADEALCGRDAIRPDTRLREDLNLDAAALLGLLTRLEERFGFAAQEETFMRLRTFGDCAAWLRHELGMGDQVEAAA